jgi:hypothetical protein
MKRRLLIFVLPVLAALIGGSVFLRLTAQRSPAIPRTVTVLENGRIAIRAYRRDGAYMTGQYRVTGQYLSSAVYLIGQGRGFSGDINGVQTFTVPQTSAIRNGLDRLDPSTECRRPFGGKLPDKTLVGYETVLGYRTVHLSYDGVDEWRAPGLACEEMKATLNKTMPDGSKVTAERHVVKVVLGEPDPSLFTRPATPSASRQ